MALPRAIQQQVDDADAFVAQMNGQTGEQPANTETDPPTDPPPDPQPTEPTQQPISQEPQPKPVTEETWQAKYQTLKGMYDAEVPRLHSQVRELNTQVQQLIADVATAKAKQPEPAPAPAKTLITEQDKEAFGSDLLDLIDRATEQKIAGYRDAEAQLKAEIAELKGKLGNVSERQVVSDKDRFLMALGQQVPDWEALNVDQGFLTWLAEVDPVYGLARQAALNNAYEAFDANRTANIFKQYKATIAPPQNAQNKPNLQSQVAPTRSRTSPAPATTSEKRVFNQQEITQFYEDWRRGYIDNDEAVRLEKEIHAAIGEGRIR
jgi:hypothetical protein